MRYLVIAAALVLLLSESTAKADDVNCDNWRGRGDVPQSTMNFCARLDYQRVDALLNKTYEVVAAKGDTDLLRKAERAWIAFRDAECTYQTIGEEGGSLHSLEYSDCLTRLTRQRIQQLRTGGNE